jgi:hypothetical protein
MSEDDKEYFAKVRPYVVGLIALLFRTSSGLPLADAEAFDRAEDFVREFEKRNAL